MPSQKYNVLALALMESLFGFGKIMQQFLPLIGTLWKMSLAQQKWPSRWKEANIDPLAKVNIPPEYADFRGINVTPVIARCF